MMLLLLLRVTHARGCPAWSRMPRATMEAININSTTNTASTFRSTASRGIADVTNRCDGAPSCELQCSIPSIFELPTTKRQMIRRGKAPENNTGRWKQRSCIPRASGLHRSLFGPLSDGSGCSGGGGGSRFFPLLPLRRHVHTPSHTHRLEQRAGCLFFFDAGLVKSSGTRAARQRSAKSSTHCFRGTSKPSFSNAMWNESISTWGHDVVLVNYARNTFNAHGVRRVL